MTHSFCGRSARDDQALAGDDHPAAILLADGIDAAEAGNGIAGIDLIESTATFDQRTASADIAPSLRPNCVAVGRTLDVFRNAWELRITRRFGYRLMIFLAHVTAYDGQGYGSLKSDLADVVVDFVTPFRNRTLELLDDRTELQRVLEAGARTAGEVARGTLADVYERVGFVPR